MTYGNVTTNYNPCVPNKNPIAVAVMDTRTLDGNGFRTDGEIKYLLPSFSDDYKGDMSDCLVLWGGNANCAWETINKLGEQKTHLGCKSIEDYADAINDESKKVLDGLEDDGQGPPSFAIIGYENRGGQQTLVSKVVHQGKVKSPRPSFFEIGSPLLIEHGYSTTAAEPDELSKARAGKLTYNGINHFIEKTDNIIVGGNPAIITFYDGKMNEVDGSYSSFISNIVTANKEEWPDYQREHAYKDIETILKRSVEFGPQRNLDDPELSEKIEKDRVALQDIAMKFGFDVIDMMSGRFGRRIWRNRKRMAKAELIGKV